MEQLSFPVISNMAALCFDVVGVILEFTEGLDPVRMAGVSQTWRSAAIAQVESSTATKCPIVNLKIIGKPLIWAAAIEYVHRKLAARHVRDKDYHTEILMPVQIGKNAPSGTRRGRFRDCPNLCSYFADLCTFFPDDGLLSCSACGRKINFRNTDGFFTRVNPHIVRLLNREPGSSYIIVAGRFVLHRGPK